MNLDVVESIARRLQSAAVIGGFALAARGYIRHTTDFDLMTTDRKALTPEMWTDLVERGFRVDVRKGESDDPLAGVIRVQSSDGSIDMSSPSTNGSRKPSIEQKKWRSRGRDCACP